MARYEHPPIYKAALDLTVHVEKVVAGFSRYHKYTLGTELREKRRQVRIFNISANSNLAPLSSRSQMLIPYTATNFPLGSPTRLIGSQTLTTTWIDIVWSAITVGKPGAAHLLAHGWHSMADMVVRSHTIYANLRQRGNFVDRSTLYDFLDPTEKGATSYFIGMAMAKLFAAKLFATPWLFHVSQATVGGASIAFKHGSKSQPDLIGQNSAGDWIVVEAKGRTNGLDAKALANAKLQTAMIRTINGMQPSLRVALQVYFDDQLRLRIDDPTDVKPEALDVKLDLDAALASYYSLVTAITAKNSTKERVLDGEFVTRVDEDSGVTIGLEASVLKSVKAGNFQEIRENKKHTEGLVREVDESLTIYPDGLLVRLDARWSPQLMNLEPESRDG